LQSNGAMKTGWLNDNGTWYYLQSNGAMKTGWLNDNGTWYYLQSNGAMAKNTTIDGYRLGSNGAWIR
ncbi:N-acetylmuramoyl-L-alanine amidase family protein, partial [Clostridium neonatale]